MAEFTLGKKDILRNIFGLFSIHLKQVYLLVFKSIYQTRLGKDFGFNLGEAALFIFKEKEIIA